MIISTDIIKDLEGQFSALCTIKDKNFPNAIAVEINKVIEGNKILITDNFMNQTIIDINKNPDVLVLVWNDEKSYKLIGKANYFSEGQYLDIVKPLNEGFPCKGVVVIDVEKII